MTDRVPNAGANRNMPADRSPGQGMPVAPSNMDQAAADFASLMGRDTDAESRGPNDTRDTRDAHDARESDGASTARTTDADGMPRQSVQQRDKHDKGSGRDSSDSNKLQKDSEQLEAEPASLMVTAGDAILQAFSKPAADPVAAVAEPAQGPGWDGIVQQIADKILVSDPAHTQGATEVRIVLKDSVLPGTEVRITQEAGRLQVQLVTDSMQSHDLLLHNQATLKDRLSEKLSQQEVVVEVSFESDSPNDGGADGRSRQRRNLQEELENQ